ncbi:isoleucine--tRNA ligase [Candidatus Campbellbacteria bacterium CG11_big_fil_rev_8_21_14_0_20_44_21]|nr:MAG: isoleucine--tRNA ligase [Candidatus Campbellbacteria bacterium CG11_big_fil_rev_8_21_14_0_20_44_21]
MLEDKDNFKKSASAPPSPEVPPSPKATDGHGTDGHGKAMAGKSDIAKRKPASEKSSARQGRKPASAQGSGEAKSEIAKKEEEILKFWQENKIFEKSLEQNEGNKPFVFYEGPPTANGRPGIHHLESRAFKDIILRFKTMRGFYVRRKAGWDTHGLPVELEVEKELGLKNKKEIEEYGIAKFNQKCRKNVWKYIEEWGKFTDRIAFWLDKENAYITYQPQYIESLWHIISHISSRGLLYKDYKVVPWCPRCGTAISSHEVAQGYKEVMDTSVYVKFKAKGVEEYFLAWTTTPWTLPGNVALAVGGDISYLKVKTKGDVLWLSKDRTGILEKDFEILEEVKGKDLLGRTYEPLFPHLSKVLPESEKQKLPQAYKIYKAPFVSTEDGSGIVHTAVMYGADDFDLGTGIGLPKHHLVDPEGKFTSDVLEYEGLFVRDADKKILADLGKRGLVLKTEEIRHTYPFCWRCQTSLIYYARDSWYIRMSALKDELVKENKTINWEPSHLKEGRFGEWLKEVKDWAISRERYWGTPLPIWECSSCGKKRVVGSIEELSLGQNNNRYFFIRHGQAKSNLENHIDSGEDQNNHLTEKGRADILKSAQALKKEKIDLIISSPILRTKEAARILSKELGLDVIYDDRIKEKNFGKYDGQSLEDYNSFFANPKQKFIVRCPGGENRNDIRKRIGEFAYDIDGKYKDKTILIVSHGTPLHLMHGVFGGWSDQEIIDKSPYLQNSEIIEMKFKNLPHNEYYELDLHRPYIDEVLLSCSCGGEMRRVKEVMDVWFDSGAMPFAEDHYPFENKKWIEGAGYPADYVSEAIDQTRGWFYTLHAIGILMGRGRAFKNVISLGHIMDKNGKKMSKSLGNVVQPWEEINTYGVDAIRFWAYSVNQPGESKNYEKESITENVRKVINLLNNIYKFYDTYAEEDAGEGYGGKHILDKWIISQLGRLARKNTEDLENYKIFESARRIKNFINDFSTWYIRRSRERFKGEDAEDRKDSIRTTRFVLLELSKLAAPFLPYICEDIYKKAGGGKESVHLEDWPEYDSYHKDEKLLDSMEKTRAVVSSALEARAKSNVKVRQPLGLLTLKGPKLDDELVFLIKDEVNVKNILFDEKLDKDVLLDVSITPELQEEGRARELIRQIQNLRKEEGLNPNDAATLLISSEEKLSFVLRFKDEIKRVCGLKGILWEGGGKEIQIGDISLKISILK